MKSNFARLIILSYFLFGCSANKVSTSDPVSFGQWQEVVSTDKSFPVARHEASFVGVGEKLYLIGGRRIQPISIYDIKSNKWTEGAAPPIELHHFQPITYNNEIYILGALTGGYPGETPVPEMWIYNTQLNQWRKGPIIPEARRRGGAGVVINGDNLYLVCGIKDGHRGDHKKWLDVYNFKTGRWQILPDAPRARDHFHAVFVKDKIYTLGGRTTISADNPFKNTIGEVDMYDIKSNSWTTLPNPLPTLRAGNYTVVIEDDILVIGGESFDQTPAHAEVEALDVQTHQWRSLPSLPVGRHGSGAVLIGSNRIYTASGSGNRGGGPELEDLWVYSF